VYVHCFGFGKVENNWEPVELIAKDVPDTRKGLFIASRKVYMSKLVVCSRDLLLEAVLVSWQCFPRCKSMTLVLLLVYMSRLFRTYHKYGAESFL
jgi:hypothetical protein